MPVDEELNAQRVQRLARFVGDWSERLRAAVLASVPAEFRERYLSTLLCELPQATDAVATITAAEHFSRRLEAMASSTVPGAQSAFAALAGQGLTRSLLAEISALPQIARAEVAWLTMRRRWRWRQTGRTDERAKTSPK